MYPYAGAHKGMTSMDTSFWETWRVFLGQHRGSADLLDCLWCWENEQLGKAIPSHQQPQCFSCLLLIVPGKIFPPKRVPTTTIFTNLPLHLMQNELPLFPCYASHGLWLVVCHWQGSLWRPRLPCMGLPSSWHSSCHRDGPWPQLDSWKNGLIVFSPWIF